MKLSKKISYWIVSGLLLVYFTTATITFCVERHFYRQQLAHSAENVAITLSYALSISSSRGDDKKLQSIATSLFEKETLSLIEVRTMQGKLLFTLSQGLHTNFAPAWFIALIQWPALLQSIDIVSGITPVGELVVSSDPSYAYDALWNNFIVLSFWFVFWGLVFIMIAQYKVGMLTKTLSLLLMHIKGLGQRHFIIEKKMSPIFEFNQLISTVNTTSKQLKKLFQKQLSQLDGVRSKIFLDDVTGFGNGHFYRYVLSSLLYRAMHYTPGFVISIVIEGYYTLTQELEPEECKVFLREIAQFCAEFWKEYPELLVARVNEARFALIIKENDNAYLLHQFDTFYQSLQKLVSKYNSCQALIALVSYDAFKDSVRLGHEIDQCIHKAKNEPNQYAISETVANHNINISESQLRQLLQQSMEFIEPVALQVDEKEWHQDILLKLPVEENVYSSKYLSPLIQRVGLGKQCDEFVIDHICQNEFLAESKFAYSLSEGSLIDSRILESYAKKISALPEAFRKNLYLEVHDRDLRNYLGPVSHFFKTVHALGVQVGVREVGIGYEAMSYLYEFPISYLKLHGGLMHIQDELTSFIVSYIAELGQILNVLIVATQVDDNKEWQQLQQHGIRVRQKII